MDDVVPGQYMFTYLAFAQPSVLNSNRGDTSRGFLVTTGSANPPAGWKQLPPATANVPAKASIYEAESAVKGLPILAQRG